MRTKTITINTYDELSDKAKEKARQWYVEGYQHDPEFEDILNVARILGIQTNADGIMWSGFWSQGDGAMFTGRYAYAKGVSQAIREYAPTDEVLHGLADRLQALQRKHFYSLTATVTRDRRNGSYYHEYMMDVEAENRLGDVAYDGEDAKELTEIFRAFARWIYQWLEADYYGETSDEAVEDTILANEYEFYSDGTVA
jgi:hypothetical protein